MGFPLVTVEGGSRLVAVNAPAWAAGLGPGAALAEARSLVPGLRTAPADPAADLRALDALADWCGRYTPWTAVDGFAWEGGGLWLDVTGCAHLLGGEDALLDDLTARLRNFGYACRAALAATPGAAWALARFGDGGVVGKKANLEPLLAPLPVAALRLAPAIVEGLDRLGLRRVADLLRLPRAGLAARFGDAVATRLDQALGRTDEPLSPRRPQPRLSARLAFAEPIGTADDLAAACESLLGDLCRDMEEARLGARRLELSAYRVDGGVSRLAVGTARPVRDAGHLARLFAEKLKDVRAGFGIEVMTLLLAAADPLEASQAALLEDGAAEDEGVDRLLDRLGNRLGFRWVTRLAAYASHIPEKACRAVPVSAPPPPSEDSPASPRPLHLLPWPEPVEALAPLPDDPPVAFTWRRQRHRVVRSEGPERIGGEWWLDDPAVPRDDLRDYYRVEDEDGRRFWLFRQGLYRPGAPPRWYLHGLFA